MRRRPSAWFHGRHRRGSTAASAAASRRHPLPPSCRTQRRRPPPPPTVARHRLSPAAATRRPTSFFARPSVVVRRRPFSPLVVCRRPHTASRRPPSPAVADRRQSPVPSSMSICRRSNLRKPSPHSLRIDVRCDFAPQAHGTAEHGGRDPPPDASTSLPFVVVSASADFPSSDSCVRPLSAHAGAVRLTAVTCGRRSNHRGMGRYTAEPPSTHQ